MAKGNSGAQANSTLVNNLSNRSNSFFDDYTRANTRASSDYDSIFNGYRSMYNPSTPGVGGQNNNPSTTGLQDYTPGGSTRPGTNGIPTFTGDPNDPGALNSYYSSLAQSMGMQNFDPSYWTNETLAHPADDPLGNIGYFVNRLINPSGGSGSSSGGGAFNSGAYGGYQNFANGAGALSWDPEFRGALSSAIGGFKGFADNGGFSDQDIQDIRARAIAPTRSVYSQAQQNVNRNRALQGYSPNYNAATAKMARDLSSQISDANVNANASIAQMVQQGKLAGLQGLTSAGSTGQGLDYNIGSFNDNLKLQGLAGMNNIDQFAANYGLAQGDQRLRALSGAASLYGTSPGAAGQAGQLGIGAANAATGARQAGYQDPNSFGYRDAANLGGSVLGTVAPLIWSGHAAAPAAVAALAPTAATTGAAVTGGAAATGGGLATGGAGTSAAIGTGSSAGSALGGLFSGAGTGAYAGAGPALIAPAVAYGLNKGGSSLLNWGERAWGGNPYGSPQNPITTVPDPFDTSNWTEDDWARAQPYL